MSKDLDSSKYGAIGEYVKDNTENNAVISVSSPVFTIYAFDELKQVLENCTHFNFLFNEPAFLQVDTDDREVKEFEIQMRQREADVSESKYEIELKNHLAQSSTASRCYQFIKDKADVRSVRNSRVMTASNILIENPDHKDSLVNGSNLSFSKEGLGYTDEEQFNFDSVDDDERRIQQFKSVFNKVFQNENYSSDVKEALMSRLTDLYKENAPELVYYLTLYQIFNRQLVNTDDRARVKERTGITQTKIWNSLYNFQHDGVVGAIKKLELYNGCIIADSVGLGKTYEALAIIKYYELRNDRVLVLCPKKLRSNWTSFKENSVTNMLAEDRFNYDVLNHTDLSRDKGKSGDINLETINWGNYDLVVIDDYDIIGLSQKAA